MTKFYSIRVVEAESLVDAIKAVEDGVFCEDDPLCDEIVTDYDAWQIFKDRADGNYPLSHK